MRGDACPVCRGSTHSLGEVDFAKSCEEARGVRLPPTDMMITYVVCDDCGHCFAPFMCRWDKAQFRRMIYNDDYRSVDHDYEAVRPVQNAKVLDREIGSAKDLIKHVDYGGGNGRLSRELKAFGWSSETYDPMLDYKRPGDRFDLVTAFEVFEHAPSPLELIMEIAFMLEPEGIVLLSTLLSDGNLSPALDWWYVAPRNGHVNLYSRESLRRLAEMIDCRVVSLTTGSHWLVRNGKAPQWAKKLLGKEAEIA